MSGKPDSSLSGCLAPAEAGFEGEAERAAEALQLGTQTTAGLGLKCCSNVAAASVLWHNQQEQPC